ncbi:MAG TPA: phosphate ABC transporter substrate-binding protein [Pseudomonadales bacterium]|nr:phosphate ABC transporter substrate-binding protein [Pseudomonadales bacterium]
MLNHHLRNFLSAVILFSATSCFAGDLVVIANPAAGVSALTQDDVSRIFLAKTKTFPNDKPVVPVNQNEGAPSRAAFEDKVLKKTPSQVNAYWTQLIFTGKGTPPKDVGNDADVKKLVADNPNITGYVDSSVVDASVVVVYKAE